MRHALCLLLALLALARGFRPSGLSRFNRMAGSWARAFHPQSHSRVSPSELGMAPKEFSVRVINKKADKDVTLMIPGNNYILDSFENKGNPIIPYSCRAGSCSSCLGKLVSGTVDQSGQIFLDDDKIEMGYVLTCAAYPTSDIVVNVNVEDEYYNLVREE